MVNCCSVTGCTNRSNRDGKSYHSIPAIILNQGDRTRELSTQRRSKWIEQLGREHYKPSKYTKICSDHFISGKPSTLYDLSNPDWIPTMNMGVGLSQKEALGLSRHRKEQRAERKKVLTAAEMLVEMSKKPRLERDQENSPSTSDLAEASQTTTSDADDDNHEDCLDTAERDNASFGNSDTIGKLRALLKNTCSSKDDIRVHADSSDETSTASSGTDDEEDARNIAPTCDISNRGDNVVLAKRAFKAALIRREELGISSADISENNSSLTVTMTTGDDSDDEEKQVVIVNDGDTIGYKTSDSSSFVVVINDKGRFKTATCSVVESEDSQYIVVVEGQRGCKVGSLPGTHTTEQSQAVSSIENLGTE